LGVGDNNGNSTLDSGDVPTNKGDVWIKGKVGIGTTNPQVALEVNGAVRIGSQSSCDAFIAGTMRYNTGNMKMEYCDGSSWKAVGGNGLIYHACTDAFGCTQSYNNSCKLCGTDISVTLATEITYLWQKVVVGGIYYSGGAWLYAKDPSYQDQYCQFFVLCEE